MAKWYQWGNLRMRWVGVGGIALFCGIGCARFFRSAATPVELPASMRSFRAANPPIDKTAPAIRTKLLRARRRIAFDFDRDGDVDGIDFSVFAGCYNKAGRPPRCDAQTAMLCNQEIDPADGPFPHFDVDLQDFAKFVLCFNGAGRPPKPSASINNVGGCQEIHEERLRSVDLAGNAIENGWQFDDIKGSVRLTPFSLPARITTITITVPPPGWTGSKRSARRASVMWKNPVALARVVVEAR